MAHYKTLLPQLYFGAYSLDGIDSKVIKIIGIYSDKVVGDGGKSNQCIIAKLDNEKPLILNATKRKVLIKMTDSTDVNDWIGCTLTIKKGKTLNKITKEMVECVDIFPFQQKDNQFKSQEQPKQKEKITDERLSAAICKIGAGEYSKEKLLANFELNEAQHKNLNDYIADLVGSDLPMES